MSCGCSKSVKDGKDTVDHIKRKGKELTPPRIAHEINCDCGTSFILETVVMNCPKCKMTYAVTPCSSDDITKIKIAGIDYA